MPFRALRPNNRANQLFNLAVMAIALGGSVWLVAGESALFIEILLLLNGALLAALVFGFRLAEGSNPQSLSIWTGPCGAGGVRAEWNQLSSSGE
jgi:hypothetical protein